MRYHKQWKTLENCKQRTRISVPAKFVINYVPRPKFVINYVPWQSGESRNKFNNVKMVGIAGCCMHHILKFCYNWATGMQCLLVVSRHCQLLLGHPFTSALLHVLFSWFFSLSLLLTQRLMSISLSLTAVTTLPLSRTPLRKEGSLLTQPLQWFNQAYIKQRYKKDVV